MERGSSSSNAARLGEAGREGLFSRLNDLRDLTSTLSQMRSASYATKMLRASTSLIRCMMFFDLCYLITGISLITVALTNDYYNKERLIILGGAFGIAASISATCNSMAAHGLRTWKRGFLVPWMIYYLIILSILILALARSFYNEHLNLRQVFLFLICLTMFSCWRHFQKQFILMAGPKPEQVVVDVEAVVRDLIIQRNEVNLSNEAVLSKTDFPPKYEEVEDLPPQYDPNTMVPNSTGSGAAFAAAPAPSQNSHPQLTVNLCSEKK